MGKNDHLKNSPTLKFSQKARELNKIGHRIIPLGLGEPGFKTPNEINLAISKGIEKGLTKYSSPAGLMELRLKVAKKLNDENNIKADAKNIVITSGSKFACMLAFMTLLEPGDEIINITPCYVSYIPQIKIAEPNSKIINISLNKNDFSLDILKIKNNINHKTKLLVINFPHNPTGKILKEQQVRELVNLAIEYDFYILSDEIYEKLNFSNINFVSPASLKEALNRVIVINGFSKSYSMTGFRIGYGLFPEFMVSNAIKLQQHLLTNVPGFIQFSAIKALELSSNTLLHYKSELKKSSDYLHVMTKSCRNLSCVTPEGGFFAFINIKLTGLSSDEFSEKLLSEKFVATTPGIAFGEDWDDHIRVSLSAGYNIFKEGVDLLIEFADSLK